MEMPDSSNVMPAPSCVMVDKEVIEEIRSGIQSLQTAMIGDRFGNKGLVRRVEDLEGAEQSTTKKLILWGGMVTGVTFALSYLKSSLFGGK